MLPLGYVPNLAWLVAPSERSERSQSLGVALHKSSHLPDQSILEASLFSPARTLCSSHVHWSIFHSRIRIDIPKPSLVSITTENPSHPRVVRYFWETVVKTPPSYLKKTLITGDSRGLYYL